MKLVCIFLIVVFTHCAIAESRLQIQILDERKQDRDIFTQGLYWHAGRLYFSSGLYGKSFIRYYDAENGTLGQQLALPRTIFAEGLTLVDDKLYILTWRAGVAFVADPQSLEITRQIPYTGQGWGLTHDEASFIMSDGSHKLYFRDKQNFRVVREIEVRNRWRKFRNLNELEYVDGSIWANVWQSPIIVQISPANGEVLGIANLKELAKKNGTLSGEAVLNGIAYDEQKKAFWITGKLWPKRYLVRFHNKNRVHDQSP